MQKALLSTSILFFLGTISFSTYACQGCFPLSHQKKSTNYRVLTIPKVKKKLEEIFTCPANDVLEAQIKNYFQRLCFDVKCHQIDVSVFTKSIEDIYLKARKRLSQEQRKRLFPFVDQTNDHELKITSTDIIGDIRHITRFDENPYEYRLIPDYKIWNLKDWEDQTRPLANVPAENTELFICQCYNLLLSEYQLPDDILQFKLIGIYFGTRVKLSPEKRKLLFPFATAINCEASQFTFSTEMYEQLRLFAKTDALE